MNYAIGSGGYKWISGNEEEEDKKLVQQFGIGLGIGIPLGDKVSFDTVLGYQTFIIKPKEDKKENYRKIIGTFGLRLGLSVLL
jgi:hypothetical protein